MAASWVSFCIRVWWSKWQNHRSIYSLFFVENVKLHIPTQKQVLASELPLKSTSSTDSRISKIVRALQGIILKDLIHRQYTWAIHFSLIFFLRALTFLCYVKQSCSLRLTSCFHVRHYQSWQSFGDLKTPVINWLFMMKYNDARHLSLAVWERMRKNNYPKRDEFVVR